MKYRPEIDGLRAIAVLSVILFHGGLSWISGGFVGVDIFFVISGYLITTILLQEVSSGSFSLLNFYERRARRILPALYLVILVSLPFATILLLPRDLSDYGQSISTVTAFISNILFWQESSYFDLAAELKPLLHTWSLAVEEQYYLFFPLFLFAFWQKARRWLFPLLLLIFAISLFLAQWGALNAPTATFYLLPTRGWELLVGSLTAWFLFHNPDSLQEKNIVCNIFSAVGILMIGFSVFTFDQETLFPGLNALVPTIGTALVILFSNPNSIAFRILSNKVFVSIGLISYSAYLWHQPIFVFARYITMEIPAGWVFILATISLFFAYLSWKYVENPFRNRNRISSVNVWRISAVSSVFLFAIGLSLYFSDGMTGRFAYSKIKDYEYDNRHLAQTSWTLLREKTGDSTYEVESNQSDHTLWFDLSNDIPKVLVVGNSHSKDIYNILSYSQSSSQNVQLARFGTQLRNIASSEATFYKVENYRAADLVILATRFDSAGRDVKALSSIIDIMRSHGKKIIIIDNVYEFPDLASRTFGVFQGS